MKVRKDEKGRFSLEMKNFDEFSAFYLLVTDKVPQVLMSLKDYRLVDEKKIQKLLDSMYKETIEILKEVPLEERKGKLFKS